MIPQDPSNIIHSGCQRLWCQIHQERARRKPHRVSHKKQVQTHQRLERQSLLRHNARLELQKEVRRHIHAGIHQ